MPNGEPRVAPVLPDGSLEIRLGDRRIEIGAEYVQEFRKNVDNASDLIINSKSKKEQ